LQLGDFATQQPLSQQQHRLGAFARASPVTSSPPAPVPTCPLRSGVCPAACPLPIALSHLRFTATCRHPVSRPHRSPVLANWMGNFYGLTYQVVRWDLCNKAHQIYHRWHRITYVLDNFY
jgi:hypothetical protein